MKVTFCQDCTSTRPNKIEFNYISKMPDHINIFQLVSKYKLPKITIQTNYLAGKSSDWTDDKIFPNS